MPNNYWMFVQSLENFEASKELGFTLHGLRSRQRRRAQRMEPDDRVLFYVSDLRKWTVTASITSRYFEDRKPIWKTHDRREEFPYRVKLAPSIVLDEADYIDALLLAPTLEYLKKWPPEKWPLAFFETLHLLPQKDFRLIEGEMKRVTSRRRRRNRRERPSDQRPRGREPRGEHGSNGASERPVEGAEAEADRGSTRQPGTGLDDPPAERAPADAGALEGASDVPRQVETADEEGRPPARDESE